MLISGDAFETSLAIQWLGLGASSAGDEGSIPGWGIKISHDVGAPKPMGQNSEPALSRATEACALQLGRSPHALQLEKAHALQ